MSRPLHLLANLGPKTAARLAEVGIATEGELRAIGAVATYARLKLAFPRETSLNALWALHAAIEGMDWRQVDAATKARLKAMLQDPWRVTPD